MIALNSSIERRCRRPSPDGAFEAMIEVVLDQVFLAWEIAFSTACICWAISRHGRPASIIAMTPRRWPSARRSRLTISG